MAYRDPHQALKTEVITKAQSSRAQVTLAKLQWSKSDIGYSLHVSPNSYSTAGLQITDFLAQLGFERSACAFADRRECYVRWVDESFDVSRFCQAFDEGYALLVDAERDLEACGFFMEQREGWGFFTGRSGTSRRIDISMSGDGHTAMTRKLMKESEDENFLYRFTWLEAPHGKGWVIHYRSKHPPLSSELGAVFGFLGLQQFAECPEYDFEECHWRSIAYRSRGDSVFDGNADVAHGWFDNHATRFSTGIEKLLATNAKIEEAGISFLPFAKPAARVDEDIAKRIERPKGSRTSAPRSFDVALSFAGTERPQAEQLATILKDAGFSVFYDDFYPEYLWGKNLVDTFDEIYRKRARYCVMFVSKEYQERMWTNQERQSAQARMLKEKGGDYILPVKVDETELAGMPGTIGYIPIARGIPEIGALLIKKLKS